MCAFFSVLEIALIVFLSLSSYLVSVVQNLNWILLWNVSKVKKWPLESSVLTLFDQWTLRKQ